MKTLPTISNRVSRTDSLASITEQDIRYRHKSIVRGIVDVEVVLMAVIRESQLVAADRGPHGMVRAGTNACIYLMLDESPKEFSRFCQSYQKEFSRFCQSYQSVELEHIHEKA